jgi:hypothetical protein
MRQEQQLKTQIKKALLRSKLNEIGMLSSSWYGHLCFSNGSQFLKSGVLTHPTREEVLLFVIGFG